jgi:serine O-acetyltransferase
MSNGTVPRSRGQVSLSPLQSRTGFFDRIVPGRVVCMSEHTVIEMLFAGYSRYTGPFPDRTKTPEFVRMVLGLLFPQFSPQMAENLSAYERSATRVKQTTEELISPLAADLRDSPMQVAESFLAALVEIQERLAEDAERLYAVDPAAKNIHEVLACYPGFFAIAVHRVAHALIRLGVPTIPRMLTEYVHSKTGIDIHPGATIGRRFVIDHGTGIVIGETTLIGDDVTIYQGVTLGAMIGNKSLAGSKRHPTLEDGVVVYANATILGGETVVGSKSTIGGNVWLTTSVPPGSKVYHLGEIRMK